MKKIKYSYWIIIALLMLSGIYSWKVYFKQYVQEDKVSIHIFPKVLKTWTAKEIKITDDEYDILETRNAFVRKYFTNEEREVYLFIVYSENNRKVSHPPEVCYAGSGVSIVNRVQDTVNTGTGSEKLAVNKLILEQGDTQQLLMYWFKVGNTYTASYWKQQLLIALKSFLGQPASSALIRISSTIKNNDIVQARKNLNDFAQLILPEVDQYLP